jgi:hypothetical protein
MRLMLVIGRTGLERPRGLKRVVRYLCWCHGSTHDATALRAGHAVMDQDARGLVPMPLSSQLYTEHHMGSWKRTCRTCRLNDLGRGVVARIRALAHSWFPDSFWAS